MTRRRGYCLLSALIMLAGLIVWLEPTRVLWGRLRGEAFYQGRPTSYWARQLVRHHDVSEHQVSGAPYASRWDQAMEWLGLYTPAEPAILRLDPAAVPVLVELLDHEHTSVRYTAIIKLNDLSASGVDQSDVALAQVRAALAHGQPKVRYCAAFLLSHDGDSASLDRTVIVLTEAYQLGDEVERDCAMEWLIRLGPRAQAAVAPLRTMNAATTDGKRREATEQILRAIDPPPP